MPAKNDLLILFAKSPTPKRVKTRLTPLLSSEAAAQLYKTFLETIRDQLKTLRYIDKILFYDPLSDLPALQEIFSLFQWPHWQTQAGQTLGDRMSHAFEWGFKQGYKRVIILGSDAPSLPLDYIREAFLKLKRYQCVLGPTFDGGYYLIGLNTWRDQLLKNIPWSTDKTLEKTLQRARQQRLSTHLLPYWFDIDTVDDLLKLQSCWGNKNSDHFQTS
jgi:uncharacterized protein